MRPTKPSTISYKIKQAVDDGYSSPKDIAKHLGLSEGQVKSVLTSLVVHEQVSCVGSNTENYKYFSLKKELVFPLLSQRWSGDFAADWGQL